MDYGLCPVDLKRYITEFEEEEDLPDLGYRWEAGLDDWEVLAELWGCSVPLAKAKVAEGLEDLSSADLAWKHAGETFDWALGEGLPNVPTRFEMRVEGVNLLTL